jgi:hypothetical protein
VRADADPTLFKRMPEQRVLTLLASLGVIEKADPHLYFRGRTAGRPGLRPSSDLALGLRQVFDTRTAKPVAAVSAPSLTVLHYDSYCSEEFVRKWTVLLESGSGMKQNGHRALVAGAVSALRSLDLSETARAAWFDRLFERVALDDVETLTRLRLLDEIDPDARMRSDVQVPDEDVAQLRALLERVREGVPKGPFHPRSGKQRSKYLAQLKLGI